MGFIVEVMTAVYLLFTFFLQRHDSDADKFMITSNHNTNECPGRRGVQVCLPG